MLKQSFNTSGIEDIHFNKIYIIVKFYNNDEMNEIMKTKISMIFVLFAVRNSELQLYPCSVFVTNQSVAVETHGPGRGYDFFYLGVGLYIYFQRVSVQGHTAI